MAAPISSFSEHNPPTRSSATTRNRGRGVDAEPRARIIPSSGGGLESAQNILAKIYLDGTKPEKRDEEIVLAVWAPTVGARIASRTRPIRLYHGKLVVDVEGHDWRRQLAAMSREITARLNAALGKTILEGIDFRVKVPASRPPGRALAAQEMDGATAGSPGNRSYRTSRKR